MLIRVSRRRAIAFLYFAPPLLLLACAAPDRGGAASDALGPPTDTHNHPQSGGAMRPPEVTHPSDARASDTPPAKEDSAGGNMANAGSAAQPARPPGAGSNAPGQPAGALTQSPDSRDAAPDDSPKDADAPRYIRVLRALREGVDARVAEEIRRPAELRLTTENVARLRLTRAELPLARARSTVLRIDGQSMEWAARFEMIEVERNANGFWVIVERAPEPR